MAKDITKILEFIEEQKKKINDAKKPENLGKYGQAWSDIVYFNGRLRSLQKIEEFINSL